MAALNWIRAKRRWLIGFLLLNLGALLMLRLLAMSPVAHRFVEWQMETLTVREQTIELDKLDGDLLGQFSIGSVRIHDRNGEWLYIGGLKARWRPLALLSGDLKFGGLHADFVDVQRRPQLGQSDVESAASASIPSIAIDRATIDQIDIAASIAGNRQSARIDGVLNFGSEAGSIAFKAAPLSSESDMIELEAQWAPGRHPSGKLHLLGQAGGMLTNLFGTPQGEDVEGHFTADYGADRWSASGGLTAGPAELFSAQLQFAEDRLEGSTRLVPSISSHLDGLGQILGAEVSLDLTSDADRASWPTEFTLDSGSGRVSGSFDFETASSDVAINNIDIVLEAQPAIRGLLGGDATVEPVHFRGDARRRGTLTELVGSVTSTEIGMAGPALLQPSIDFGLEIDNGVASATVDASAEDLAGLGTSRLFGEVLYRLDQRDAEFSNLSLQLGAASLLGSGRYASEFGFDLAGVAEIAAHPPMKSASADWAFAGKPEGVFNASLVGDIQLDEMPGGLSDLLGTDLTVSASLGRDAELRLHLIAINVESETVQVNASGTLGNGSAGVNGSINSQPITYEGSEIGLGEGEFLIAFVDEAFELDLDFGIDGFVAQGITVDAPHVDLTVKSGEAVALEAFFKANIEDTSWQLAAYGEIRDQQILLPDVELSAAEFAATGHAAIPFSEPLASQTQWTFGGSFSSGAEISGSLDYDGGRYQVDAAAANLRFADARFASLNLQGEGDFTHFILDLDSDAEISIDAVPVSAVGTSEFAVSLKRRTALASIDMRLQDNPIKTLTPLELSYGPNASLAGEVELFGGLALIDLGIADGRENSLTVTNVRVEPMSALLGRPDLIGTASGRLDAVRTASEWSATAALTFEDLASRQTLAKPIDLSLRAELDNGLVDATFELLGLGTETALNGTSSFSVLSNTNGMPLRLDPSGEISAAVYGSGDIATLAALAGLSNVFAEGRFEADLAGRGPGDTFQMTGPISIQDGAFEEAQTGLALRSIDLDAVVGADGVTIPRVRAQGWNGGSAAGQGVLRYDGSLDIALQLASLDALNRDDVRASVSGPISLVRRDRQTKLEGSLTLDRASVDLSQIRTGGFQTLDVRFESDDAALHAADEEKGVEIDLSVSADRRLFVTSPQIESEWGLDIDIQGYADDLNWVGSANLIRGSAELLTSNFRLQEGALLFNGALSEGEINLLAVRRTPDFESQIRLSGGILEPTITLSSDPAIPEEEILSRILFGRSSGTLTAFETAQLALAAASLTSGGNGLDLIGSFRETTGLDRIAVGQAADGSAALTTGKYLADDVYLEVETGASGTPVLELEWTPLNSVQIDTQLDPELGPRLGIQWRRDFDRLLPATDEQVSTE